MKKRFTFFIILEIGIWPLFQANEDPSKFKSEKCGRGPLTGPDWKRNVKPVMTAYKLVTIEFKWLGLQVRRIENNALQCFNKMSALIRPQDLLLIQKFVRKTRAVNLK